MAKRQSQERPEQREGAQREEETVDSLLALWLDGLESDDVEPKVLARSIIQEAPESLRAPLEERIGELLELSRLTVAPSRYSAGEMLGSYVLTKKLGQGTTGTVWAAEDSDGHAVALKIIHPLYQSSPEGLMRLNVELEAASRVRHPALVGITGRLEEESAFVLVTALVGDGRTLADELTEYRKGEGHWDSRALVARLLNAMRGVGALHAAGILHLDLKPANILIANDRSLMVADFGLARIQDDASLTRTIQVLGTPAYMSPELARGDRRGADKCSDVFALGAILFEVLTLSRPFGSGTPAAVMHLILNEEPVPMPSILGGFSRSESRTLRSIVGRCLEKNSEDRYPDAGALARELEHALGGQPVVGMGIGRRLALISRRYRRAIIAGTVTVVMIAGALIGTKRQAELRERTEGALELATRMIHAVGTGVKGIDAQEVEQLVGALRQVHGEDDLSKNIRISLISSAGGLFCERGLTGEGLALIELALSIEDDQGTTDARERARLLTLHSYYKDRNGDLEGAMEDQVRAADLLSRFSDETSRLRRAESLAHAWVDNWMLGRSGSEILGDYAVQDLVLDLQNAIQDLGSDQSARAAYLELLVMHLQVELGGVVLGLAHNAQAATNTLESLLGPNHQWVLDALAFEGWVNYKLGEHSVALGRYSTLKTRVVSVFGDGDVRAALAEFGLATSTIHLASKELQLQDGGGGHLQRIQPLFESAVSRLTRSAGPDSRLTLHARLNQAVGEGLCGRHENKQALLVELLVDMDRCLFPSDPIRFTAYRGLYETYVYQGRFEEAGTLMAERWRAYIDGLGGALPIVFNDLSIYFRKWPLVCPGSYSADLNKLVEVFVLACRTSPLAGAKDAGDWVQAMADRIQAVRDGDPEGVSDLREAVRMPPLPTVWYETQWATLNDRGSSTMQEYIQENWNASAARPAFLQSLAFCRAGRLDEARASLARLDPMEEDEPFRAQIEAQRIFAKARIMQKEGTSSGVEEMLATSDGIGSYMPMMRSTLSFPD
jgi:hypothetical protein